MADRYLIACRRRSLITQVLGTVQATSTPVIGPDPNRWAMMITTQGLTFTYWSPISVTPQNGMVAGAAAACYFQVLEETHGEAVREAWFAVTNGGTNGYTITSISYLPEDKERLDRDYRDWISQL